MNTLTPRDAEAIRREVPLLTKVSENVDGRVQIIYSGGNWNTQWRGISPEYLEIRRWTIDKGEFITDDDVTNARTVVVIGDTVRRRLFGDDDPLGERVRIGTSAYTIIGTLAAKGPSANGYDQDDTVMVPWTTAMRRLAGRNQTWLDDILCSAMSTDTIREAGDHASALLRERHRIALGADDDFNIRHPEELLNAKVELARRVSRLLALLALLSLAIGGIGIMNVMLASVAQRTTEIGLRMAVGATPAAVRLQFLGEATLLTTLAGGVGVALGIFAAPSIGDTLGWRLEMSATTDVLALGFAAAVGVCFGMYPAIRASRMDPIAALRVE
jgi:putative ABC transport system permease protein